MQSLAFAIASLLAGVCLIGIAEGKRWEMIGIGVSGTTFIYALYRGG